MSQEDLVIIGFNLMICVWGASMCIKRLAVLCGDCTKLSIRWQYAIWFSVFAASACSMWTESEISRTQLFMSLAILAHLILGSRAWRHGPPAYTFRIPRDQCRAETQQQCD